MLATDVGLVVVQVLLDLSAAFDTIDHSILLHRLKYRFGVSGPALEWFASYLSERYQYIRIGKLTSSKRQISRGVPQGSVLGPLLFTMYISPLGDVIRKHGINFHMYADDVQLYISFRPCDQMKALHELQHCLDEVDSWLRQNRLLLNGKNMKMITFGTKQRLTVATNIHVPSMVVWYLQMQLQRILGLCTTPRWAWNTKWTQCVAERIFDFITSAGLGDLSHKTQLRLWFKPLSYRSWTAGTRY